MALETGSNAGRTTLADGTVRIEGGGHVAQITRLKPGAVLVAEAGTQTPETRAAMIREIVQEMTLVSPVSVFVDLRASSRMDGRGRDEWSKFGRERRENVRRVVVLVRSRLLEMAFSVIGMFVGGGLMKIVSDEQEFVDEIKREVPTFRALPPLAPSAAAAGR